MERVNYTPKVTQRVKGRDVCLNPKPRTPIFTVCARLPSTRSGDGHRGKTAGQGAPRPGL